MVRVTKGFPGVLFLLLLFLQEGLGLTCFVGLNGAEDEKDCAGLKDVSLLHDSCKQMGTQYARDRCGKGTLEGVAVKVCACTEGLIGNDLRFGTACLYDERAEERVCFCRRDRCNGETQKGRVREGSPSASSVTTPNLIPTLLLPSAIYMTLC